MKLNKPILYIMAGLPGTGKTTLSQMLSKYLKITHLRIDTVEQALRDLCSMKVEGEGYRLSYRIVSDNLRLGNSVIADSCNPIHITRDEWKEVATKSGAKYINIEIICSDKQEHQRRIETRTTAIPNFQLPTWEKVLNRQYDEWKTSRIVIDTAGNDINDSFNELLCEINKY